MEEKERYYYEKILRDCVIPEGLFEIKDREGNFYLIIENKKDVDTITNLLNQQDKHTKLLEEENQQLKQQLHDLPKKIVGEIKKELYDCGKTYLEDEPYIEICIVQGILNTILKKFGGKE